MARKKPAVSEGIRIPSQRPGPVGGKRDENRKFKQQLLLKTACDLFKRQGLEGVSIDEIVNAAEVAKGSFYNYFADKTDLVRSLFRPLVEQLDSAFQEGKEKMRQAKGEAALFLAYQDMASLMAQACLAAPDLVLIYLAESRGAPTEARQPILELSRQIMRHALELTEIAQERKLLRPFDPRISSLAVIGAIEQLLFAYLREPLEAHPLELTVSLISMVLEGLQEKSFH